jgi:hypothetical protein
MKRFIVLSFLAIAALGLASCASTASVAEESSAQFGTSGECAAD